MWKNLCASSIVTMQAAQNREGDDLATCMLYWHRSGFLLRNLLSDPLMRSCLVKVVDIGSQHPLELLLLEDEQVIETLATHTAQKPFTDRIGPWGVVGRFEYLDAAGCGHARKTGFKLAITITDEILRCLSIGSRFPQLLRRPGIGRRASDPHMDDSARVQFDDEEGPPANGRKGQSRGESRKPRSAEHVFVRRSSTSVLVVWWHGPASCTSEWCV
jgi:hypothetical protein